MQEFKNSSVIQTWVGAVDWGNAAVEDGRETVVGKLDNQQLVKVADDGRSKDLLLFHRERRPIQSFGVKNLLIPLQLWLEEIEE